MRSVLKGILTILTTQERRGFLVVLGAATVTGIIQMAGVGSIIPFVTLLLDPGLIQRQPVLLWCYQAFRFGSAEAFLIFVGASVLSLLVVGNAFTAATLWLMTRFAWNTQLSLSLRLFAHQMSRPYAELMRRNSSENVRNILFESTTFTTGILLPFLNLVSNGVNALFVGALLLWIHPGVSIVAAVVFGASYGLIYRLIRRRLIVLGRSRLEANQQRLRAVTEAFASIKEVKVMGREEQFAERFRRAATIVANHSRTVQVMDRTPRYAIEVVAFGLLVTFLMLLLSVGADMKQALPMAAGFAFAGYRLMPALQNMYSAFSALRTNRPVLNLLLADSSRDGEDGRWTGQEAPLVIRRQLQLDGVSYSYPGAEKPSVSGVTLTIPHPSFVAFVGRTGAGKTTLADLILGLLIPGSGEMRIDDTPIDGGNRRSWQRNVGYVPQEICLIDESVTANIAFGIAPSRIDQAAVERAARMACIHSFIVDELPNGYDTVVGERGIRLSGGQRQRIGLARALYHDPSVLVLDEATSALDKATEQSVHEALISTAKAKTVIVIAHRMTTVRDSDRIFVLEQGRLVDAGKYEDLLATSVSFRLIAETARRGSSSAFSTP